jgi:hypothetical protein
MPMKHVELIINNETTITCLKRFHPWIFFSNLRLFFLGHWRMLCINMYGEVYFLFMGFRLSFDYT